MRRRFVSLSLAVVPVLVLSHFHFTGGTKLVFGQEIPIFQKFCGRVPIVSLPINTPDPEVLNQGGVLEICDNGVDDDEDGQIDYADDDCLAGLGLQSLILRTPFQVVEPVGDFPPARFTGGDKDFDSVGELVINTTGPGGRKVSYLRTDGRNSYRDVSITALVHTGINEDGGGPLAVRIQPRDAATNAGMSYVLKTVPGDKLSIDIAMGDGTTTELASVDRWGSGEFLTIQEDACYFVDFSARGQTLTATVSEVQCDVLQSLRGSLIVLENRTVTVTATDGTLSDGFIGLRSDKDSGGDVVSDREASSADASVMDYVVSSPDGDDISGAPLIAFFHSYSSSTDDIDYSLDPARCTNSNPCRRAAQTLADTMLAAYLRSLGFRVHEYTMEAFTSQFTTPEEINANYDLWWLPSSGASNSTRGFFPSITIPTVFAEHVDGRAEVGGLTADNTGNERQVSCGNGRRFSAPLDGAQEAPDPVDTDALGIAMFEFDPDTRELSFSIEFSGLSAPESNAHIHRAPAGEPGPVIHPLPAGSPKVGSVTLSEDEAADLLAGNLYVNIHSENHRAGEIRGQITQATLSPKSVRVFSEDEGGAPDHPIVRGLADENGDIEVHDTRQVALNTPYRFPSRSLTGADFEDIDTTLRIIRGWGSGHPETQFVGYPVADGAFALAGFNDPCTGEPFRQLNEDGTVGGDGRGHMAIVAAEAGTPRFPCPPSPDQPGRPCEDPGDFEARVVFYFLSDRGFPYTTPRARSLVRRSALWALGLLDSRNRSDTPFQRGDTNGDGKLDITDGVAVFNFLFLGGDPPRCLDAGDSNDDEALDIADGINTLNFLFLGGARPKSPFLLCFQGCGLDLTPGPVPGEVDNPGLILSCDEYNACR